MLTEPNDESPANIQASIDWRSWNKNESNVFRKKVNKCVRDSLEALN